MHSSQLLMTEGSISGKMIRFAVPVFIGNLFQQLYNTADALIVGNFVGNDALAAVSTRPTTRLKATVVWIERRIFFSSLAPK